MKNPKKYVCVLFFYSSNSSTRDTPPLSGTLQSFFIFSGAVEGKSVGVVLQTLYQRLPALK